MLNWTNVIEWHLYLIPLRIETGNIYQLLENIESALDTILIQPVILKARS